MEFKNEKYGKTLEGNEYTLEICPIKVSNLIRINCQMCVK